MIEKLNVIIETFIAFLFLKLYNCFSPTFQICGSNEYYQANKYYNTCDLLATGYTTVK